DRKLLAPPHVDCPAPFARRMHYIAQVTGDSIYDRLIRLCFGDRVEVSITTWGGPFLLVTGFFRRATSYILIATQPLNKNQTLSEVIALAPRSGSASALLQPLSLRLRRWFTRGFMQDDIDRLGGIRYNPHTLIDADRLLIEYFHWAAALPHGSEGHPRLLDTAAANGEEGAQPFEAIPQVPECRHVESPS